MTFYIEITMIEKISVAVFIMESKKLFWISSFSTFLFSNSFLFSRFLIFSFNTDKESILVDLISVENIIFGKSRINMINIFFKIILYDFVFGLGNAYF